MKKILILLGALFVGTAVADTKTITWYNGDSVHDTTTCTVGGDLILPTTPTKYGYTFQGWNSGYTKLEYISASGKPYINTGINQNQSTVIRAKFQIATPTGSIFGIYESGQDYRLACNTDFIKGSTRISVSSNLCNNQIMDIEIGDFYIKDFNTGSFLAGSVLQSPTPWQASYAIKILHRSWDSTGNKFYLFKIWQDGTLVRDMIPVSRNTDGVVGMFDKVTGTFFTNVGTGTFIAGPAI